MNSGSLPTLPVAKSPTAPGNFGIFATAINSFSISAAIEVPKSPTVCLTCGGSICGPPSFLIASCVVSANPTGPVRTIPTVSPTVLPVCTPNGLPMSAPTTESSFVN